MKQDYLIALTYPELFLASTNFVLANMIFIPTIGFLYIVDESMFVSEIDEVDGKYVFRPKEGVPTWWTYYYAALSVLWGNYAIFEGTWEPEIDLIQFYEAMGYMILQFMTLTITFIPVMFWASADVVALMMLNLLEMREII